MSATLEEVKTALRIEAVDTTHDARIAPLLAAANLAVAEASGVDDWTDHPNLVTASVMLTVMWFEAADPGAVAEEFPAPVRILVNLSRTGWVAA